jgi:hypothetical protein
VSHSASLTEKPSAKEQHLPLLLVMALGVVLALIVLAQILLLLLVRSRKLSAAGRRRSVRGDEPLRLGCCRTATEIENF